MGASKSSTKQRNGVLSHLNPNAKSELYKRDYIDNEGRQSSSSKSYKKSERICHAKSSKNKIFKLLFILLLLLKLKLS